MVVSSTRRHLKRATDSVAPGQSLREYVYPVIPNAQQGSRFAGSMRDYLQGEDDAGEKTEK